jgi:hypothetical protein
VDGEQNKFIPSIYISADTNHDSPASGETSMPQQKPKEIKTMATKKVKAKTKSAVKKKPVAKKKK